MEDLQGRTPSKGKLAKVAQVVSVSPRTWTDDADLEAGAQDAKARHAKGLPLLYLAYQSVGVIFGGVGTSPLYSFPNVFSKRPSSEDVLGATCLMLWTLTIIMVLKYILVVMHANDNGEGGTFAMYSLLCRHAGITPFGQTHHTDTTLSRYSTNPASPRGATKLRQPGLSERLGKRLASALQQRKGLQQALLILVLAGTAMVLGDGVLTPAASVMSAMAGLRVADPRIGNGVVVGVSCAILVLLFACQRFGTAKIAAIFSPILIIFLLTNAAVSAYNIGTFMPSVFKCLSPHYGLKFFIDNGKQGWIALGGIVLSITGSEAMFADMGHFTHKSITIACMALVYPCLMIIYLGEAAYLATHTSTFAQSYYRAIPRPIFWPMFVIATLAALVGSQSLISSAFSIIRQAASMHCFPRVKVVHTGKDVEGQIYIPEVNWVLCLLAVAAVLGFRNVNAIGFAFGVAVVFVMFITTILTAVVMILVWHTHLVWLVAICMPLLFIEGVYMSAVLFKVPHGGWFPVAMASVVLFVSYIWHWGSASKLAVSQHTQHQLLETLLTSSDDGGGSSSTEHHPSALSMASTGRPVNRSPGLALYYSESLSSLPASFIKLLRSVSAVHQANIFLTIRQVPVPSVLPTERYLVRNMSLPGFYRVICRFGYADQVDQGPAFAHELVQKVAEYMRFKALHAKWSAADIYDEPFQLSKEGRRATKASHLKSWPVLPHILPTMSEGVESVGRPSVQLDRLPTVQTCQQAQHVQRDSPACGSAESSGAGAWSGASHSALPSSQQQRQPVTDICEQETGIDGAVPVRDVEPIQPEAHPLQADGVSCGVRMAPLQTSPAVTSALPQLLHEQHSQRGMQPSATPAAPHSSTPSGAGAGPVSDLPADQRHSTHRQDQGGYPPQDQDQDHERHLHVAPSGASRSAWFSESEVRAVLGAEADSVTYVLARSIVRAKPGWGIVRRFLLETVYAGLAALSRAPTTTWQIPLDDVLEVRVTYAV